MNAKSLEALASHADSAMKLAERIEMVYETNSHHMEYLMQHLQEIWDIAEQEIKEQSIKASRGTSEAMRFKVANGMIAKMRRDGKEAIAGTWMHNGKQYMTDGFIMAELNEPIPELPEATNPPGLHTMMDRDLSKHNVYKVSIGDINAKAKVSKAKGDSRCYHFETVSGDKWWYDIHLMKKLAQILGAKDFEIYIPERDIHPAMVVCENGRGIILPIRKK